MDVNLRGVGRPIQEFIHKLIEINDCVFYQVRLVNGVLDHPVARPVITLAQLLRCFGGTADEEDAKIEFSAVPAKGPHACGMLRATTKQAVQFELGSSGIQLYLTPVIEIWYLVNRGVDHNAVKLDTFDRVGIVLSDGRHRGVRNVIMGDNNIDLRLSDEAEDVLSLHVVN